MLASGFTSENPIRIRTLIAVAKTGNWRRGLARIPSDPVREPEDSSVRLDGLVQRRDRHQCPQQVRGCDSYIHTCRDESSLPCRRVSDTSRLRCGPPPAVWQSGLYVFVVFHLSIVLAYQLPVSKQCLRNLGQLESCAVLLICKYFFRIQEAH